MIGGGVVGCSIAYHLARRGQRDVVVLERETVGAGTTSKAAGGIRSQFPTETEIPLLASEAIGALRALRRGVRRRHRLPEDRLPLPDLHPEDLAGYRERMALQRRLGVDVREITRRGQGDRPRAAGRRSHRGGVGTDRRHGRAGRGHQRLRRRARELGARIVEGVDVTAIDVERGRVRGVRTSQGAISRPS